MCNSFLDGRENIHLDVDVGQDNLRLSSKLVQYEMERSNSEGQKWKNNAMTGMHRMARNSDNCYNISIFKKRKKG
jgi:hypothetical protein